MRNREITLTSGGHWPILSIVKADFTFLSVGDQLPSSYWRIGGRCSVSWRRENADESAIDVNFEVGVAEAVGHADVVVLSRFLIVQGGAGRLAGPPAEVTGIYQ